MGLETRTKSLADNVTLVEVEGRLNAVVAPDLKEQLKGLVASGRVKLLLDLTAVSFIDSSGLAALVSGFRAARENGGTIKLAGLNDQTRTVFRITKLDRVFEIHPDVEAALASEFGAF
jgi:anti-sigma B factor antagonist